MLQKKTALVTGASRGIGRGISTILAQNGIAVCGVGTKPNDAVVEYETELKSYDADSFYLQGDISSADDRAHIIETVYERFGHLDFLINNAGITRDKLILNMDEKDFDTVISVNLKGTFNMIKHTYKHFMKKRFGRIVSTSSIVGLNGNAGQANYSASKAGIIGLTKSVAKELAGRGVTANAVAPGYIGTDMTNVLSDKVKDAMKAQIPAKRIGTPEDVANVVAFLCSDEAAYVTGEVIRVDGGLAM